MARAAADRGLAFLALRAISDAQEERLPPIPQIVNPDGEPGARRLAAHLVREPGRLVALLKLARNASRARQALTTGVACTVTAL